MVKVTNFVFTACALHWCSTPGEGAPPRETALRNWNAWNAQFTPPCWPYCPETPMGPQSCVPIWRRGFGHKTGLGWNGPPCQPISWLAGNYKKQTTTSTDEDSKGGRRRMKIIPLIPRPKPGSSFGWMPVQKGWNPMYIYQGPYTEYPAFQPDPNLWGRGWSYGRHPSTLPYFA